MAQLFKTSFEIVQSVSNSIVAFLKNSINIFIDIIINGIIELVCSIVSKSNPISFSS